MVKPIRDAMIGVVYANDSQIRRSEHEQANIDGLFPIRGISRVILSAFHAGREFVYIRVEDAPLQTELPK